MIRNIVAARGLIAMSFAAVVGSSGVYVEPRRTDNLFVSLITLQNPPVFRVLAYGNATPWSTTTFFAAWLGLAVLRRGDEFADPRPAVLRVPRWVPARPAAPRVRRPRTQTAI